MAWVFRDLDDSAPMSADQLKKFIEPMDKLLDNDRRQEARRAGVAGRADQGCSECSAPPAAVSSRTASRRSG